MTTYEIPKATGAPMSVVQEFAESVAKHYGFTHASSIEALIGNLGGTIHYLSDLESLSEDADSLYVNGPNDFEIRVSAFSNQLRNRFTIAHELGHYFLHARLGEKRIKARRKDSDRVEWEANWFAGAFLMPESEFKRVCAQYTSAKDNADSIATYFGVSRLAAEVRMKALGIQ